MNRPEQALHKAVARFLDAALAPGVFWTSLDHAGGGATVGAFRKARGVRKGLPDILIIHRGAARFIELKAPSGKVSKAQKDAAMELEGAGSAVWVCRNLEEVQDCILRWQIPIRGWLS